jgi:threonine/homoserine/homoserine lactone efflux protein
MEPLGTVLRGFVIGLSITAAVGPISLLCIQRTLADGRLAGFVCGMGAATADGLYGCVAGEARGEGTAIRGEEERCAFGFWP